MGIDKLRLTTPRQPTLEFFDAINADFRLPNGQRSRFSFPKRVIDPSGRVSDRLTAYSEASISTRKGVEPSFYVELNFHAPGGKEPPKTILECNPNKFPDGWKGVQRLVDWIFSDDCSDLKLSRVDLNADVEGVSVDYLRGSMRAPRKRKGADVSGETWKNKGIETFYIGKKPSKLRVYDKIQELRYQGEDLSKFPAVLTRVEWEFRHDHCPVKTFSELPLLLECHAFMGLQFLGNVDYYDFRTDYSGSMKRHIYRSLVDKYGTQEGVRLFNGNRNFARDFKSIIVDNVELKNRIQDSFLTTTRLFFDNKCADVRFIYNPTFGFQPIGKGKEKTCRRSVYVDESVLVHAGQETDLEALNPLYDTVQCDRSTRAFRRWDVEI